MADVLLVAAPLGVRSTHAQLSPPLGLASIGASCEQAGLSVTAVDFNLSGLNPERLRGLLAFEKPRVVGISATTETWTAAKEIAAAVKKTHPAVKVVVGGPHPSILPQESLRESAADYVIAGPGEKSFTELARRLVSKKPVEPQSIPGLHYRSGKNRAIKGNAAEPLGDPDLLPWADRSLFPIGLYRDRTTVLTSVGSCPYQCSFCSASAIWKGRRHYRSPENVIGELKMLKESYGITDVFFSDDIFTVNRNWTLQMCDALQRSCLGITWGCATRVDRVDDELLEVMAASGCDGLQYGVESGAEEIMQSAKGIDKDLVRRAVRKARELDIDVLCSFMTPFPEDTLQTLTETRSFVRELAETGATIAISYTCPYPGTPLYERADELGIRIIPQSWEEFSTRAPMIETKHLNADQIRLFMEETAKELGLRRTAAE
ncbi:MAG: B12-binding domain-containing radical SAM protein [Coriobacteriia bacterium]|nr:B12-binding domain-containing radical SAM protein [Coriobacteriia bacterium]